MLAVLYRRAVGVAACLSCPSRMNGAYKATALWFASVSQVINTNQVIFCGLFIMVPVEMMCN